MTQVRCSVDTCHFWGEGQVCNADSIWVKNNMNTGAGRGTTMRTADTGATRGLAQSSRMEFADEPGTTAGGGKGVPSSKPLQSANTSTETCCGTMKPRAGQGDHGKHTPRTSK